MIFQLTSSRRGWLLLFSCYCPVINISTHILTKRMTFIRISSVMHQVFQLTSSRRGWQLWSIHWNSERGISTHILTKRMTMTEKGRRTWNFYFNSHPHEEDDDSLRLLNCHADISTHILTKRMTITAVFFQKTTDISTHILTKRMTTIQTAAIA